MNYYINGTPAEPSTLDYNHIADTISSFGLTAEQACRVIEVMKASKPSKAVGSNYAWAFYIRTGANKEGSFEAYMKHNQSIKATEWEFLNGKFKK
jgi:hypothetical protein